MIIQAAALPAFLSPCLFVKNTVNPCWAIVLLRQATTTGELVDLRINTGLAAGSLLQFLKLCPLPVAAIIHPTSTGPWNSATNLGWPAKQAIRQACGDQ
jgi:hypothetical protein